MNVPKDLFDRVFGQIDWLRLLTEHSPLTRMGRSSMDVPPGYVAYAKGNATYWAKERLKKLGGFWDPVEKRWYVPGEHAEEATAAITLARKLGRELTEDEVAGPLKVKTPKIRCFECGDLYTAFQIMQRGGNPGHYYCGCGEIPDTPTARLPTRRTGTHDFYSWDDDIPF